VVLRSLGKFYGLPGLRLGFAAGPRLIDRFARMLSDWPVSNTDRAWHRALGDTGSATPQTSRRRNPSPAASSGSAD
jgi:histidinol-phosphate/aromatic aminotransferase/cobyric acid decarboxylase-like protein